VTDTIVSLNRTAIMLSSIISGKLILPIQTVCRQHYGLTSNMNISEYLHSLERGRISTIAGAGYSDGVPAKEADAGWPLGVVRRPDGDLIVNDYWGHRIWRIDKEGILHRFAGDGIPGCSPSGLPALDAHLHEPHDLAQDEHGNLFFSELGARSNLIRRIDYKTGVLTTVAGSGRIGRGGDGGLALDAELDCACGVAVDDHGDIYISSEWMNNIRRVDYRTGLIDTAYGHSARHYPSEAGDSRPAAGPKLSLGGYHGDGGPAKEAGFNHPEHLAFDSHYNLYVCDNSNDRIRRIDRKTGIINTVLGNGQRSSNGDGGPATEASTLMPDAICLDRDDNLYVGEKYGFRIRKVEATTGLVTTLAGNGVPGFGEEGLHGSETHCNSVEAGIFADPDGTVFWGDCSGRLRQYDGETGVVTTVFGGTSVHDGEIASNAFFCGPSGIDVDTQGHIYIADTWGQRIRRIDPRTGVITTIAGQGTRAYGGDNGPADGAHLGNPYDVSVDSRGRVVIADNRHGHVRRVDEDGVIRNVAGAAYLWDKGDGGPAVNANFISVTSVAHDLHGNIYVGDSGAGRIRRIDAPTGVITSVAGTGIPGYTGDDGAATSARIGAPRAMRFDRAGNLFFADRAHHTIRRLDAVSGIISTVAGTGTAGYSPDGTYALGANLHEPCGLAISAAGEIYFSDTRNNLVRRITQNGRIETVAGCSEAGDYGNRSLEAGLNEPYGLCFFSENVLLICDHWNNKIKAIRTE
jgi:trimeric autotransporter adhesin